MGSNTEPRKGKDTVCFGSSKKQNEDYVFLQRQGMKPDGEGEAMGWGGDFYCRPCQECRPYFSVLYQGDTVRFGFFCGFLDPLGCRVAGPEGEGAVAGSGAGGCMIQ